MADIKDLDTLVPAFAEVKEKMDNYKKVADKYNKSIKDIMRDLPEKKFVTGNYEATFSVATIEKMNEDAALDVIKDWWASNGSMECPFIKRIETVDFDQLEDAIYKGEVPQEVLSKLNNCRSTTSQERLTVKLKKKED